MYHQYMRMDMLTRDQENDGQDLAQLLRGAKDVLRELPWEEEGNLDANESLSNELDQLAQAAEAELQGKHRHFQTPWYPPLLIFCQSSTRRLKPYRPKSRINLPNTGTCLIGYTQCLCTAGQFLSDITGSISTISTEISGASIMTST